MIFFEWSEDDASDLCDNYGTHHNQLEITTTKFKLHHDGKVIKEWDLKMLLNQAYGEAAQK